jgi:GNAT superfamily N-acetyltransferase
MSAIIIEPFQQGDEQTLREIFFESSTRKDFADNEEKEKFFNKYLGYYLKSQALVLVAREEGRILGYLVGSFTTEDEILCSLQPHLLVFKEYFSDYPAHLHINCHGQARGKGIGSLMVRYFEDILRQQNIKGLHIMTAPGARNCQFYHRLGFNFERIKSFQGTEILFMGKRI